MAKKKRIKIGAMYREYGEIQTGTANMRRADCITHRSIKSINRYLKEEMSNEYTIN